MIIATEVFIVRYSSYGLKKKKKKREGTEIGKEGIGGSTM